MGHGPREMTTDKPDPEIENARIIAKLREIFEAMALRLAPDIEPALIYMPKEPEQ